MSETSAPAPQSGFLACELCDAPANYPCEPYCAGAVEALDNGEAWPALYIPFPTADTLAAEEAPS